MKFTLKQYLIWVSSIILIFTIVVAMSTNSIDLQFKLSFLSHLEHKIPKSDNHKIQRDWFSLHWIWGFGAWNSMTNWFFYDGSMEIHPNPNKTTTFLKITTISSHYVWTNFGTDQILICMFRCYSIFIWWYIK